MAADEFYFTVDRSSAGLHKPRVREIKFGDGYNVRLRDGLNTKEKSWNVSFVNRSLTEAEAILDFLDNKAGAESFTWTPPGQTIQYKVICKEWRHSVPANFAMSIYAVFNRVFDP